MISAHTSPVAQPGAGDAGGLNVYVIETARHLAAAGVEVDVFTRATARDQPSVVEVSPGVRLHRLLAGPLGPVPKEDLPGYLPDFAAALMREATDARAGGAPAWDLVHSHYWMSGQAAWPLAQRSGIPLVHTPHTLALVKNSAPASRERPEPAVRLRGEEHLVAVVDKHITNTADEAEELIRAYHAPRDRVVTVHPGVDLSVFRPAVRRTGGLADRREARLAHREIGLRPDDVVLLFVGRLQPLKGPDVALRAAAELLRRDSSLRSRLVVVVAGGPSGPGADGLDLLAGLASREGLDSAVRFVPPMSRDRLADLYRSADLLVMPSHSESFGLVALEAQACGTPVVAARVGGLSTAVSDGASGVLVPGHDPGTWASVLGSLIADPVRRGRLELGAVRHAAGFAWSATASNLLREYGTVLDPDARLRRTDTLPAFVAPGEARESVPLPGTMAP